MDNMQTSLTFHNTEYPPNWAFPHEKFGVLEFVGPKNDEGDENLSIHLFYGLVYNWDTSEWVDTLPIGKKDISLEKYFVKSENPSLVRGFLFKANNQGCKTVVDEIDTLPDLIEENGELEKIDHMFYMIQYLYHTHSKNLF